MPPSMDAELECLARCVYALQHWFWVSNLQLNPDKSDVAFFWTPQRLKKSSPPTLATVTSCSIVMSNRLKVLGVTLNSSLTFERHIDDSVKACNFHLHALSHIRRSHSNDTAKTVAHCIVGSRINYCNAVLLEAPWRRIVKLQRVQGNLASVVIDVSIRNLHDSSRNRFDLVRDLHWLLINSHLTFKLATSCCKKHHFGQPSYISNLLHQ